jgi:ABC-type Zn uptake system ZnuABC Zn-binding protein ZnuA
VNGYVKADEAVRLKVSTTNTLFEDFVREIGAEHVTVKSLVPPTVSPSKYHLKPVDIRTVSDYDLFLYGTWETWAKKIISALRGSKVRIESIPVETGGIWGDPAMAKDIAEHIADRLITVCPGERARFTAGLTRETAQFYRQRSQRGEEALFPLSRH